MLMRLKSFDTADQNLHAALCDNFNTPAAMKVLTDLIGSTNKHMFQTKPLAVVKDIARWVTRIVTIFGLDSIGTLNDSDRIGWATSSTGAEGIAYLRILSEFCDGVRALAASSPNDVISERLLLLCDRVPVHDLANLGVVLEEGITYLRTLSDFRDGVRALAISNPNAVISERLLLLCDRVRDHNLANLGVVLEDRDLAKGEPARIRFVSAEELKTAGEEKEHHAAEKEREKEEARLKKEEKDRKREELAKVSHWELFKTGDYSEWDEQGIPTRDKEGVEITKSGRKTLVKGWERQKKLHEAWLKAKGGAS